MRLLVHEFMCGGGTWSRGTALPAGSLLDEGRAMALALAEDALLAGTHVDLLWDARLPPPDLDGGAVHPVHGAIDERHWLLERAARYDGVLLIAPECDHCLLERCRWVADAGGTLYSPDAHFVALTGDKQRLNLYLAGRGVPVPPSPPGRLPAIVKPRDGAGSQDIRLVHDADRLPADGEPRSAWVVEEYCAGVPASVTVLSGPRGALLLPAGRQCLSNDGCFRYLAGEIPLENPWQQRAHRLARSVVDALPATTGFWGIDLVLGEPDVVIEVNPRLTTSYLGLRQLADENLVAALRRHLAGEEAGLRFRSEPIRFAAAPHEGDATARR